MYSRLQLARKYLRYYLNASNEKGHGIHSPFVFDLVTRVLNDARDYPDYARVEGLRRRLLQDGRVLKIEDLGAGSSVGEGVDAGNQGKDGGRRVNHRSVAELARHAAKPRKLGQLLFRIARHYQPLTMLELGTSLGLSAAYLASGAQEGNDSGGMRRMGANEGRQAKLFTIEGAPSVAATATVNFRSLGLENIEQVTGGFDDRLPGVLERIGRIDLTFVDGNHRKEPTLRYFNLLMGCASSSAVLIFDDIHWSREMEEAWEAIKQDPRVLLTVDLFFIGLVFLREEFKVKQDFIIRF